MSLLLADVSSVDAIEKKIELVKLTLTSIVSLQKYVIVCEIVHWLNQFHEVFVYASTCRANQ